MVAKLQMTGMVMKREDFFSYWTREAAGANHKQSVINTDHLFVEDQL